VSNNHLTNQSETQHESDSMKWQSKTPMTVRQAADTFLAEHFPVGFRQLSQLNVTLNAGFSLSNCRTHRRLSSDDRFNPCV